MQSYHKLLLANKAWAHEMQESKPGFFENLTKDQKPEFLWIGCSDSRVPAEEITGAQPGEIFVHRNIANMVIQADLNAHSVVQYAVDALKVKNIIVCGHYGCGGIRAALSRQDFGLLNKWLYFIKQNYSKHYEEIKSLSLDEQVDKMVEFNVQEQVKTLAHMALMQRAWRKSGAPNIHGWVFGLKDGLIRELTMLTPSSKMDEIYQFKMD